MSGCDQRLCIEVVAPGRHAERLAQIPPGPDHIDPHGPAIADADDEPVIDLVIAIIEPTDRLQIDLDRVALAVVVGFIDASDGL